MSLVVLSCYSQVRRTVDVVFVDKRCFNCVAFNTEWKRQSVLRIFTRATKPKSIVSGKFQHKRCANKKRYRDRLN